MQTKIQIIVATHKRYPMPQDAMYLPLQVGRAIHPDLGFTGDNTGESISAKNENYCELTGLYWAWKNLDAEYIGLCHYRRYFAKKVLGKKWSRVLTEKQAECLLKTAAVLLPRKRNYWIETNYSQYAHAHHAADLDRTRDILVQRWPKYVTAFDAVMQRTTGHRFNMLIMRRDLLDAYCTWLFAILAELETRLDISEYSANDKRVFGFVSERLLDVWLETNKVAYRELPVVNMESQHWIKKGTAFLKRKFSTKNGYERGKADESNSSCGGYL